jgi:hypothetical protein
MIFLYMFMSESLISYLLVYLLSTVVTFGISHELLQRNLSICFSPLYLPACLCQYLLPATLSISNRVPEFSCLPACLCQFPPLTTYLSAYLCQSLPSANFQAISASVPHQLPASLSLPVSPISYLPACLCQCPPSATCQTVSASVPHQLPSRLSLPVSPISYLWRVGSPCAEYSH